MAPLFEELSSRTILLRYITTERWWYFWESSTVRDWRYIVTSLTMLEDIIADLKSRYILRGELYLKNHKGDTITHADQLGRYETYTVVVE